MAKYDPNVHILLAEKYARDGLSNEQIALKLGIAKSTFQLWLIKFPDFSDPIKTGKFNITGRIK